MDVYVQMRIPKKLIREVAGPKSDANNDDISLLGDAKGRRDVGIVCQDKHHVHSILKNINYNLGREINVRLLFD